MASPIELWGGLECTVNRVGDRYFDQIERSGHAQRLSDLDLFAGLGIVAMRYGVIWERTAPNGLEQADWSWADQRLERLREIGIRPIVGLVHHGSGPRHTSLVDAAFPEQLAEYARAVAGRYPWVDSYTPVNEPLSTARFSGLYGHWYPHGRDDRTFVRALLTECRATVLAMQAIREVRPTALLVQTEDLGKAFSTRTLAYQADFENERRWLSFDLLCGRVDQRHPLWRYLRGAGASEAELLWFTEHPCPPDILGINHYLSSERFLDERLDRYPPESHGGNAYHGYADVLAARVTAAGAVGPAALLGEAWERYGLPLAVTEAHNGCTREEQLRWLREMWEAAHVARRRGADVRAFTIWSLLGAYDWDQICTQDSGFYEPGAFDLRGPEPRPTAIAAMVRGLASAGKYEHPVLDAPGWWQRGERLWYPPVRVVGRPRVSRRRFTQTPRPLLICGARGTLGAAFARVCDVRGLPYRLLTRQEMDVADRTSVLAAIEAFQPWAIVNATGYVRVDEAETDVDRCYRENVQGPSVLAVACAERGISLVTFSSDLVFDGAQQTPYVESHAVGPLNVYGSTKVEGERAVLAAMPNALVIRTSAFFGPWDPYNFVTLALAELAAERTVVAAEDVSISPTYVPDLVQGALDLLIDGEQGRWHLANGGEVSWAELARSAAQAVGLDAGRVEGRRLDELAFKAQRPRYSVLGSERDRIMPELDDALSRYLQATRAA